MTLPNYRNYHISVHFQDRAKERFNVDPIDVKSWVSGIAAKATFLRKSSGSIQHWGYGEIELVLDVQTKNFITVHAIAGNKKQIKYDTEIVNTINESLVKLRNKVIRRTAIKVNKYVHNNAELYRKIADSRNNRFLSSYYEEITKNNSLIQQETLKQNKLIEQIDIRIKG